MYFPLVSKNKTANLPTIEHETTVLNELSDGRSTTTPPNPPKPWPSCHFSNRVQEPIRYSPTSKRDYDAQSAGTPQSTPANTKTSRPGLQRRRTTARTRYIDMLLGLDDVSPLHNILASGFVWILLAGYIVFPATFTKLQSEKVEAVADTNIEAAALRTVRNIPLLYIAAFACGIGILGCVFLWWKHRKNYVWVINRIFLPALLNSLAGLISTIVSVYSAQDGRYSVTAMVTIVVTAACSVVAAGLFLIYNTVMLSRVKRRHEKEVKAAEREDRRDSIRREV
ncbi:hypothetical protein NX059_000018 [Plenodomus lindquistii]|nr:hypothetical protein NX059_000018 [Plenodomus lindquistii]